MMNMDEWRIERLERSHRRDRFHCGQASLDEFIQRLVRQYDQRNLGRTYVAVRGNEKQVFGYYTLAASSVPPANLPADAAKKLPRHPVPVALLARLAVDRSVQGQGLGKALLLDCLRRCFKFSHELGIHAVEVHAIDESAIRFYQKFGFVPLLDSPSHLFLLTSSLADFKSEGGQTNS